MLLKLVIMHVEKLGGYNYESLESADAWGSTALNNPFRYRGYYYDTHFALYYLNSRYYDSNTGRFISADGYVSTGQGLIGSNMYAYCYNNPIMHVDPTGEIPKWLLITLVAVAVVVTVVVVTTVVNHIINAVNESKIEEELDDLEKQGKDLSNKDTALEEINNILYESTGKEEVTARLRDDNSLEILNSFEVGNRYTRQKICMIYTRTGLTTREYDNLSAEWNWHNLVYPFFAESTQSALLEASGDARPEVYIPTVILEVLGWD